MFRSTWTILRELTLSLAKLNFCRINRWKCIFISFAVLWQHVFQVVVCVLSAVQRTLHRTQYTHHNLKHMLPQHCKTYKDAFSPINSTKV